MQKGIVSCVLGGIVVAAAAGFIGYEFAPKPAAVQSQVAVKESSSIPAGWVTYTDPLGKFSFAHPSTVVVNCDKDIHCMLRSPALGDVPDMTIDVKMMHVNFSAWEDFDIEYFNDLVSSFRFKTATITQQTQTYSWTAQNITFQYPADKKIAVGSTETLLVNSTGTIMPEGDISVFMTVVQMHKNQTMEQVQSNIVEGNVEKIEETIAGQKVTTLKYHSSFGDKDQTTHLVQFGNRVLEVHAGAGEEEWAKQIAVSAKSYN